MVVTWKTGKYVISGNQGCFASKSIFLKSTYTKAAWQYVAMDWGWMRRWFKRKGKYCSKQNTVGVKGWMRVLLSNEEFCP